MRFDRYQNAWQEHGAASGGMPPAPNDLWTRIAKMERTVFWRDAREYVACFIVVAVFGFMLFQPVPVLVKVGAAICIAASVLIAAVLTWARRAGRSDPSAPVREHVRRTRDRVRRQARMLKLVGIWYVAPVATGITVIGVGVGRGWLFLFATVVLTVGLVAINWWAADRYLVPLVEELEQTLIDLA